MATSMVPVPAKTWTLISTVSKKFQIPEQNSAWAVEASVIPTNLSIRNRINPGIMYTFQKLDGNLYIYSDSKIEVSVEPLS